MEERNEGQKPEVEGGRREDEGGGSWRSLSSHAPHLPDRRRRGGIGACPASPALLGAASLSGPLPASAHDPRARSCVLLCSSDGLQGRTAALPAASPLQSPCADLPTPFPLGCLALKGASPVPKAQRATCASLACNILEVAVRRVGDGLEG